MQQAKSMRPFLRCGMVSQTRQSGVSTSSTRSTTPQTKMAAATSKRGKISRPKCIAHYSRKRRKPGQLVGEKFMAKRPTNDTRSKRITDVYLGQLARLDGDLDAQAALTFKMWDILNGSQTHRDDEINAEIICQPDAVPAYVRRDVLIRKIAIDPNECEHCHGTVTYIDHVTDQKMCEDCGAVHAPVPVLESPFANKISKTNIAHFRVVNSHVYDRMSHFKALLHNIQGLGQSKLCPLMLDALRARARTEMSENITHKWVCSALRAIKMGKFSPQAVRIAQLVSDGRFKAPVIEKDTHERLLASFVDVCVFFDEWIQNAVTDRKNFMSYPYIAFQIFSAHSLAHLHDYLTLIKSDARREVQNKIWQGVCERAGWPFAAL